MGTLKDTVAWAPWADAVPKVLAIITASVKMLSDTPAGAVSLYRADIPKVLLQGGVVTGRTNGDGSQVRMPGAYAFSQHAPANFVVEDFVLQKDVCRLYTFPCTDASMVVTMRFIAACLISSSAKPTRRSIKLYASRASG